MNAIPALMSMTFSIVIFAAFVISASVKSRPIVTCSVEVNSIREQVMTAATSHQFAVSTRPGVM